MWTEELRTFARSRLACAGHLRLSRRENRDDRIRRGRRHFKIRQFEIGVGLVSLRRGGLNIGSP
jgi:hypothetical protein